MLGKRQLNLRCPICKKPIKSSSADVPFCSERCRLLDLGKWASGEYVVSSPVTDAEDGIRTGDPEDDD